MIDQATIQRILDAAQIVEVVSDYVTLRKRGANFVGLCPFHTDRTPSFYVSPSKNICKCFSCGEGGTAVHFIMKHEQLGYQEALKHLAKKYGIEVQEREMSDAERQFANERESMLIVNEYAQDFFSRMLYEHEEGQSVALPYFRERGVREDIIKKFQLGYNPEQKDALVKAAATKGFNPDYLDRTGLIVRGENYMADRFRGRIIFPVHTLSGKVIAFGGRILKKTEKLAKYINSPESSIYRKSDQLYGIYFAKQAMTKQDKCYLVEGYTDVLSMHQAGFENVVASSGTALTGGQIRLIKRFTSNITVLYDGDSAGIKAALRGIDLLLGEGMNVRVILLPEGEDPDSFARSQNATAFAEYLTQHEEDFIRFKTRLLIDDAKGDPIKFTALISDVVDSIAIIPDAIARSVYVQECSRMLKTSEQIILTAVNKRIKVEKTPLSPTPPPPPPPDNEAPPEVVNETETRSRKKERLELDILHFLVRYYNRELKPKGEELPENWQPVTVGQFIISELETDGLTLSRTLFQLYINECKARLEEVGFIADRYFLAHEDELVSRLTAQLISDKYQLSKIHSKFQTIEKEEDQLYELVPRVVIAYKDYILQEQIQQKENQLRASNSSDPTEAIHIMAELKDMHEMRKILSQYLGERIILKF